MIVVIDVVQDQTPGCENFGNCWRVESEVNEGLVIEPDRVTCMLCRCEPVPIGKRLVADRD